MCRRFLIFLLFLVPLVQAAIIIDDLSQQNYNLGDHVIISGYMLEDKDLQGIFQLDISCDEVITLLMKSVSVKRGQQLSFYEELPVFFTSDHNCTVIASLMDQTKIVDQTQSTSFFVTQDLYTNLTLQNTIIQLGKPIEIFGQINTISEKPVYGLAVLTFLQGKNIVFTDTVDIKNGTFFYQKNSTGFIPGEYFLDIDVTEFLGNKKHFENILHFTLVNEVPVFIDTAKDSVLPGSSIIIFGEANTVLQDNVQDGEITLYFDEEKLTSNIRDDGQFEFNLYIPENISSGKKDIRVSIVDSYGNIGEAKTSFDVLPLPTSLNVLFEKIVYLPEDSLLFTPYLYDQAGDVIEELIKVEFIDSENNVVATLNISSSLESTYIIPENAISGDLDEHRGPEDDSKPE